MNLLREILRVVTEKTDVKHTLPDLISGKEVLEPSSLSSKFFAGLRDNSWKTDDDAAHALYGTDSSDQRYRTLKSRSYDKLLQALVNVEIRQPEHSEFLTAYYKCMRNQIAAQTLLRFASRKAGTELATRTLTIAQKYELTDVCLQISSILRDTSAISGQRKPFIKYNILVKKYIQELAAEYESFGLLDDLTTSDNPYRSAADFIMQATTTVAEIRDLVEKYPTHTIRLNYFRVLLMFTTARQDYDETISTCNSAIEYLTSRPHLLQKARLGEFSLRKLLNCIFLRRYEEAAAIADDCLELFAVGGNNWFLALDQAFIASCNRLEFSNAVGYFNQAIHHPRFNSQSETYIQERWILYHAYLVLANKLGLCDLAIEETQHFRLSRYLNSVPAESKDKRVANVLILVSHTFFLILEDDLDGAERRIEYLKVYSSRYLREKSFARVRIFIRMLYNISNSGFDPIRAKKTNQRNFEQLRESASDPMPVETNELIPFEILIERLMDHLVNAYS